MSNTTSLRPCPRCGTSYGVGPHTYIDTLPGRRAARSRPWRARRCRRSGARGEATEPACRRLRTEFSPRESSATAHTAMPSARPIAPRPSRPLRAAPTRGCRAPSARAAARAPRRGSRPSPSMCGASRGVSAAITTSTLSTHQPVVARPAATTSASSAIESASRQAARRSRGTACRDRAGRPGRAARRRPRARPRRRRSGRRAGARRRCARRRARAAARRRTDARRSRARPGSSRVAAPVEQRLRELEVVGERELEVAALAVDDHDRPAAGLDERGVVGVDRRRPRARRATRRRGTPAASAPRRGRRAAPSRRRGRRRRASPCRRRAAPGTAPSAPSATACDDAREQPRATRAGAPRRARRRCRRRRARSASPARTESERVAPPAATLHARRARSNARRPGSTTTTPSHDSARDADRAVEHARAAEPRELLGRAEARAATGRDDDRPGPHGASMARRARRDGVDVAIRRRRGGRTAGGRRWSARPR